MCQFSVKRETTVVIRFVFSISDNVICVNKIRISINEKTNFSDAI